MFGSGKKNMEIQVRHLKESLENMTEEKKKAERELEDARARITELEEKLAESDLESLKKETKERLAEYQGLKELYLRKNREFDDSVESREESFAKEEALARYHLESEIEEQKAETERIVSETVGTFSDTYNYYLNQIKVLMDALGDVASATGKQLFSAETGDLKAEFGRQMANALKRGTDTLPHGSGNRILIGTAEEEEQAAPAEEAPAEVTAEEVKTAQKPARKNTRKKSDEKAKAGKPAAGKKNATARATGKTARKPRKSGKTATGNAAAAEAVSEPGIQAEVSAVTAEAENLAEAAFENAEEFVREAADDGVAAYISGEEGPADEGTAAADSLIEAVTEDIEQASGEGADAAETITEAVTETAEKAAEAGADAIEDITASVSEKADELLGEVSAAAEEMPDPAAMLPQEDA